MPFTAPGLLPSKNISARPAAQPSTKNISKLSKALEPTIWRNLPTTKSKEKKKKKKQNNPGGSTQKAQPLEASQSGSFEVTQQAGICTKLLPLMTLAPQRPSL
jgi:hypothetical protein